MRVVTALAGEAFPRRLRRIPEEGLEAVDGAPDVLNHFPVERDAVKLSQAGDRIDLLVERDRAHVVRAQGGEQQSFAALALQVAPTAVRPEAVPAVVAQATECLAQVIGSGTGCHQIAL